MTTVQSEQSTAATPVLQSAGTWKRAALGELVIAAAALAVYWPSLSGNFIMDDDRYLTNNSLIASPNGLYRIWCTNELIDYWPLTYTSFWLEWRMWRLNPVGYRATNLVLHVTTCLLLWVILRRLSIPGAFLAALLFAVHPVNVEAVAWISQRNEMLAALFLMLSVLWYVRSEERREARGERRGIKAWYWLSLTAFLLAVLSKISVASMPPILLLIAWWRHGRLSKWDFLRSAPFFGISLAMIVVQLLFQKHGDAIPHPGLAERMAGGGTVIWFYLSKALAPINQSFIYPHWNIRTGDLLWWLPLIAAVGITLLLGWRSFKPTSGWWQPLFFAWAYCCLALTPVLGLIQNGFMVHSLVADRYQHLAIIGVLASLAAGWCYWRNRAAPPARWGAYLAAFIVVGAFGLLTFYRSQLYGDPVNLFASSTAKNPDSYLAEIDLALALDKAGRTQDAIEHCRRSLQLKPDSYIGHNVLGVMLEANGQHEEALKHYQEALRLNPKFPEARNNLGILLETQGRILEAIEQYQYALGLRPNFADARDNLGNALLATGHPQEAIEQYRSAIEINPDDVMANFNLANLLASAGRFDDAIEYYRHAVLVKRDYADAHYNLGIALAKMGKTQEAITHFEQALQSNPNSAAAHNNLGNALVNAGRPEAALEHYRAALRVNPQEIASYVNLSKAYVALHRSTEAIATAQKAVELARSQGDEPLAKQIESWMTSYRAEQAKTPGTPPSAQPAP